MYFMGDIAMGLGDKRITNYIMDMRALIGQETLLTVGCGAIIVDKEDRILLQRRRDFGDWCIPGGTMELGETFVETMTREVYEETNLKVQEPRLFGIYSGEKCYAEYPNGDKIFSVQIIFYTEKYEGILVDDKGESFEHKFFSKEEVPTNLNPRQAPFILDWKAGKKEIVIS